jgi:hypothetical protein
MLQLQYQHLHRVSQTCFNLLLSSCREHVHHLRKPESQKHHRDVLAQVLTSTPVFYRHIPTFQRTSARNMYIKYWEQILRLSLRPSRCCNTREYIHNRQICKINADIDTCRIAHIQADNHTIFLPLFSHKICQQENEVLKVKLSEQ